MLYINEEINHFNYHIYLPFYENAIPPPHLPFTLYVILCAVHNIDLMDD